MRKALFAMSCGVFGLILTVGIGTSQDTKKETKETKESKETGKTKGQLPQHWKHLKLTDEQKRKVYDLHNQYKAKIELHHKQINDLKAQEKTEMLQVLTDEQKTVLHKLTFGEEKGKEKAPSDDKKESK